MTRRSESHSCSPATYTGFPTWSKLGLYCVTIPMFCTALAFGFPGAFAVLAVQLCTIEHASNSAEADAYSQTLEPVNQTLEQWNFQQMFTTIIRPE